MNQELGEHELQDLARTAIRYFRRNQLQLDLIESLSDVDENPSFESHWSPCVRGTSFTVSFYHDYLGGSTSAGVGLPKDTKTVTR